MSADNLLQKIAREAALNVPPGATANAVLQIAREAPLLVILPDDAALETLAQGLDFFGETPYAIFPAWDCLPFDRVSPHIGLLAHRLCVLGSIKRSQPAIILTSVNALVQKTLPIDAVQQKTFQKKKDYARGDLEKTFHDLGYSRAVTVREMCEYAIRGDIIDIFPAGANAPLRLEFFGDGLEKIHVFDAVTQLKDTDRDEEISHILLVNASEAPLGQAEIFRKNYHRLFGRVIDDPLLESVMAGIHYPGIEHWLPLYFEEPLPCLLDWLLPETILLIKDDFAAQCDVRFEMIADHYQARLQAMPHDAAARRKTSEHSQLYLPVPQEQLYLDAENLRKKMQTRRVITLSPQRENLSHQKIAYDFKARAGQNYRDAFQKGILFDLLKTRLGAEMKSKRRVIFACMSQGSRTRLAQLFVDHDMPSFAMMEAIFDDTRLGAAVLDCESFEDERLVIINEADLLGERMRRRHFRKKRAADMLSEINTLQPGDYVIHAEHGIGCYQGLQTMTVHGVVYECLHLSYANKAVLYLPVENIDLLSLYGRSGASQVRLDSLGSVHWQNRKARMKKHLLEIADKLVETAAKRQLKRTNVLTKPEKIWDEFCARFPYVETEDQLQVIDEIVQDFQKAVPMDRLVCGDAGFGKTEIALRAALMVAYHEKQVILVAPTTLLARQHYQLFQARFAGFGVHIAQLSRLVNAKDAAKIRENIANGTVNIIIGTHSVLSKNVTFHNPGLLIIDEEQHFGVKQKERLKRWDDLHILTMTATPIPRSLNFALSGLRDLSLMTTPPVDRLAVRTFVTLYDSMILGEAVRREMHRGGQIFCVVPRIGDLPRLEKRMLELAPAAKIQVAHGQMPPLVLEKAMTAFVDGHADMLLCTHIIESGLDIPRANTIIIFHPEKFGLAQLYQLRGRVGRGKLRGYCYLILPPSGGTPQTRKRLDVMQSLDSAGAGFQIASHDMDLRGSGNLLGEAQSGKIEEVGAELYHTMLREAIGKVKGELELFSEDYSPQVKLDVSVMIPESYVTDSVLRMGLYQRLAKLEQVELVDDFAEELVNRFGSFPEEVKNLLQVMKLRLLCESSMLL